MTKAEPELVEAAARAHYESYFEQLIGCCEEPWERQPADHQARMLNAMSAGLAAIKVSDLAVLQRQLDKLNARVDRYRNAGFWAIALAPLGFALGVLALIVAPSIF